jgi:hypothetical protein
MKKLMMVPAALALLVGCASNAVQDGEKLAAREEVERVTGTLIPRKNSNSLPSNVSTVDKTSLENAQRINAGTINGP